MILDTKTQKKQNRPCDAACYTAGVKSLLKALTPAPLLQKCRSIRLAMQYRGLSVQETFSKVYATNAWGGAPGEFCSGLGSAEAVTSSYIDFVSRFVREHGIESTLDLGCGDFRVGSRLPGRVIGADVVPELISRNQKHFPGVTFACIDIIEAELPDADLCLIRQVFQHLSNAQIERVLKKLRKYRYILVTEHQFLETSEPNLDKRPGPHIREGSGIFLDMPPFDQSCSSVLEVRLNEREVLRTVLISN